MYLSWFEFTYLLYLAECCCLLLTVRASIQEFMRWPLVAPSTSPASYSSSVTESYRLHTLSGTVLCLSAHSYTSRPCVTTCSTQDCTTVMCCARSSPADCVQCTSQLCVAICSSQDCTTVMCCARSSPADCVWFTSQPCVTICSTQDCTTVMCCARS